MTTLVTGATGLIGNNLVRLLLAQGESVRVIVRPTSPRPPLEGLQVEVVTGDIRVADEVERAVEGASSVLHAAAFLQLGREGLALSRAINVDGSRNLATAARSRGIRMVHVSTVDTLGVGRPNEPATEDRQFEAKFPCSYSTSKTEAEQVVHDEIDRGLDAVVVHPTFTVGPWDWKPSSGRMLLAVARQFTPLAPSGGHTVADVRDVAQGILNARDRAPAGEHYILGGETISYFDFWKLCAEVTGASPPYFRLGVINRKLVGQLGDLWTRISGNEGDVNSAMLELSAQWHYYSSRKAEEQLDYSPRPMRESVEDSWNWFREHGYA